MIKKFWVPDWGVGVLCATVASILGLLMMLGWRWQADAIPSYGDLQAYFVPIWDCFRRAFIAGHLPWWNEIQDLGYPFLANPQCSVFHLPNYILLISGAWGVRFYLCAAVFLHSSGVYQLLRNNRASRGTASLMSVAVSLGGFFLALHSMTTVMYTFAWAPWAIVWLRSPRRDARMILCAGFAISQMFLAGAWDVWAGIIILILAYEMQTLMARTLRSAAVGIASLGFVLPQLVLTLPYLARSSRHVVEMGESLFWSAGAHDGLALFSPNAMLSVIGSRAWEFVFGERVGWVLVAYPGVVVLVTFPLIVYWMMRRRRLLLCVMGLECLVAFSGSIPGVPVLMSQWHISIPLRYPDKWLLGLLWMLILITWERIPVLVRTYTQSRRHQVLLWLLPWIAAWPLIAILCRERMLNGHVPFLPGQVALYVSARQLFETSTNRDIFFVTLAGLLVWVVVYVFRRKRHLMLLIGVVWVCDALLAGTTIGQAQPMPNADTWLRYGLSSYFSPGRSWRINAGFPPTKSNKNDPDSVAIRHIRGESISQLYSGIEIGEREGWSWLQGVNVMAPFQSRIFSELALVHPVRVAKEIFYRTSTSYVIGYPSQIDQYASIVDGCLRDSSSMVICHLSEFRPKFHFAKRLRTFPTDSALVRNMVDFAPDREAVYLRDPLPGVATIRNALGSLPQIKSVSDSMGRERRVRIQPGGASWLIMATTWDPGWKAWVDSKEVPVMRMDYALCGVELPDGAQEVYLRYSPQWWWESLIISLLLLLSGAVGFAYLLRSEWTRHIALRLPPWV